MVKISWGEYMNRFSSNTQAQIVRLRDFLLIHKSITTLEARQLLDIFHPAARIKELREKGDNITTTRETGYTNKGSHKGVGRYTLLSGSDHE